jgi:imidazole glycerol-phosphate synthase subunit HisH
MIAIVDYGMGNLRSVAKALERAGATVSLLSSPVPARECAGIVLPGVGAFGDAMANLKAAGWDGWLRDAIAAGTPFLGICLGFQLLFSRSAEGGDVPGLSVIPGEVRRLPSTVTVPHMGWNQIRCLRPTLLLQGVKDGDYVYFVHSYRVVPADASVAAAVTDYGADFVSAAARGNVWGAQFHPEKSQEVGLRILKNFVGIAQG